MTRFNEWYDGGTFVDIQYNLFNRKSFVSECCVIASSVTEDNLWRSWFLYWVMKLKVFVKTPVIYYVRRDAPDSDTNSIESITSTLKRCINERLDFCDCIDRILDGIEFFDEHPEYRRATKMKFLGGLWWHTTRRGLYKDGITPEIDRVVQETFEKYFGQGADFVTYLFHMVNLLNMMQPNSQVEGFMSKNFRKNAELQK